MSLYVPIRERPALEVASTSELKSALEHVHTSGLPVFVMRAVSESDYRDLAHTVADMYSEISDMPYRVGSSITGVARGLGAGSRVEIGKLHEDTDALALDFGTFINLSRTTQGAGKGWFANSGPGYTLHDHHIEERADYYLKVGRCVDSSIISPEFHVAELSAGDVAAFMFETTKGATWHRYDTSVAPRNTDSIFVEPAI